MVPLAWRNPDDPAEFPVEIRFGVEAAVQHRLGEARSGLDPLAGVTDAPGIDVARYIGAGSTVYCRSEAFFRQMQPSRQPRQGQFGVQMNSLAHQEDPKARNHFADFSGGNADALGWLSAGLVERAAVNDVLSAPSFAPFIDARRIGVLGFSLGAQGAWPSRTAL
jgi:hypothetical protein